MTEAGVVGGVMDTVLADTVGFIRHLPHDLVAVFKATLEETRQATLLLHTVDAADTLLVKILRYSGIVVDE